MVKAESTSGKSEIAIPVDGLAENDLANITSFADVAAQFQDVREASDVLGNGFGVLEDKSKLLNVEFVVVKYAAHTSDKNGGAFSTLHVVTREGEKLIVNDGSTGIHAQCKELKEKYGNVAPLFVRRGLRVSEYDYTDEKTGLQTKAKTFYLNTGK
jgi:hypothetical protein